MAQPDYIINMGTAALNNQKSIDFSSMLNMTLQSGAFNNIPNIGNILSGVQSVEMLGSGNSQQQASAVQSLISNVMSMISKLGTGETAEAGKKVNKNKENADNVIEASDKQIKTLSEKFGKISEGIKKENETIKNAVDKAAEKQKALEAEQKKIVETVANINELKNKLGSTTDPATQQEYLTAITTEVGNITASISIITELKSVLETQSQNVENAYKNLANYSEEADATQENGVENLEAIANKAQETMADNVLVQTESQQDRKISQAAAIEAGKTSTNLVTGVSIAPQLYKISADRATSSTIKQIGSATVWNQIVQGINNISNGASLLTSYGATIGSALGNCENLVGSWNDTVSPMIKSIGSFDALETQVNSELCPAIQKDRDTVSEALQNNGNFVETKEEDNNQQNPYTNPWGTEQQGNTWTNVSGLKTPNITLKFGV